jgi:hypothetical protein
MKITIDFLARHKTKQCSRLQVICKDSLPNNFDETFSRFHLFRKKSETLFDVRDLQEICTTSIKKK